MVNLIIKKVRQDSVTHCQYVLFLQIPLLDNKPFERWHQLDKSKQLDSIVAYLEGTCNWCNLRLVVNDQYFGFVDQNSGYLVREHFDHSKLFTSIISNYHKLLIMQTWLELSTRS